MKRIQTQLITIVILIILFIPVAKILTTHYSASDGFLGLIYFGRDFYKNALPEIKEISPVTSSPTGYDGQFYAQLALRPTLADPALEQALDNPTYRARRIGLSWLAYCLGLGKPNWVLQIYALLNTAFWLGLLVLLYRFVGFKRLRDWLLVFALLWSTGALTSVTRALPDLPAAVLGVWAVFSPNNWIMAAFLLGASGLIKETSALSFMAIPWGKRLTRSAMMRLVLAGLIVFLPITLWLIYVYFRLPSGMAAGIRNFSFPFLGIAQKLSSDISTLVTGGMGTSMLDKVKLFSEIICVLSIIIQALYLVAKPRFSSTAWRLGVGFVILLAFLGASVWVEQLSYCRVLLPLTFAFNLLIHEREFGYKYWAWYLLGNGGMGGMLIYAFI